MTSDRQNFRALVDDLPEALFVCQGEQVVYANRELAAMLGYEADVPRNVSDLVPAQALVDYETLLESAGGQSSAKPHVQEMRRADGGSMHGRTLMRAIRWKGAPAVLTLVLPLPVSHRPPELLRLLETAVDHLSDHVVITEADSLDRRGRRIVYVNRAFCASTGYEPAEVIGKTPNLTIGPRSDSNALKTIAASLDAGQPVRSELLKYRKDGSTYHVDLEIVPVHDSAGRHTHWVSVHRDISDRKRMQSTLEPTARLAAVGRLAAGVAHEINNPLSFLMSNLAFAAGELERLQNDARSSLQPVLDALNDAQGGADRVSSIVRDLERFSSRNREHPGPASVKGVLSSVIRMSHARLHGIATVTTDVDSVPKVEIGEDQLGDILLCLLLNAVESRANSTDVDLNIVVRAHTHDGNVIINVIDDGDGIPPGLHSRIFEPFFTTKTGTGAGLGLSICHSLVASAGGAIEFESDLRRGTTFRVSLPVSKDTLRPSPST